MGPSVRCRRLPAELINETAQFVTGPFWQELISNNSLFYFLLRGTKHAKKWKIHSVDIREHNAEYVIDQRSYSALIPRCLTHRDRDEFLYEGLDWSDFFDPTDEGDRICLVSIRARGVNSRQEVRSFFVTNTPAICTRFNCVFSFHELPLHDWDIGIVKFLGDTKLTMWDSLVGQFYEVLQDFEHGRIPSQILPNSDSPPALDESDASND